MTNYFLMKNFFRRICTVLCSEAPIPRVKTELVVAHQGPQQKAAK